MAQDRNANDSLLLAAAQAVLEDMRTSDEIHEHIARLFFRRYTTEEAIKVAALVHALREALTFTVDRNIEDRAHSGTLQYLNTGAIGKDGKTAPETVAESLNTGAQSRRERRSLREALGDDLRPERLLHDAIEFLREDRQSDSELLDDLTTQDLWTIRSLGDEARGILESRVAVKE
jgi:hypothetical protein